jgi:TetR/AcrR family transcriptional repressor of nem operon
MARQKEFNAEVVLEQAMSLFWQQGYEATSIRDLIAHLGISSSSMYETYGDKRTLYLAALSAFRQQEFNTIEEQLAEATSAQETMQTWFDETINNLLADEDHRGTFSVNAAIELGATDPQVAAQLQAHFDEIAALLAQFFQTAQVHGEIREDHDPVALAQFFINTLFSISIQVKIYPNRQILENVANTAIMILT